MKVEQVKKLLAASPFRPFAIDLLTQRRVQVRHRDYAWFQDDDRTLWVEDDTGQTIILDVMLVQAIVVEPPSRQT